MLRIERHTNGADTFRLIGCLNAENVAELQSLFELENKDRQMILEHCEKGHIRLINCPAYIREWIKQERDTS